MSMGTGLNQVLLYRDGNMICALLGQNTQDGTVGFGKTVSEALHELAKAIEAEGIDDEILSHL